MAANLDHLLTLTYRENLQDSAKAWRDLSKFIRLIKRALGITSYPFVAVQEVQKRGAIHIHAAVTGFQNVSVLRSIWHQVIGSSAAGNIDVQFFGNEKTALAKYLSKYLAKDMAETGSGTHRYKRARGIHIGGELLTYPANVALDSALIEEFALRGSNIKYHRNQLSLEGPKWLWACSW